MLTLTAADRRKFRATAHSLHPVVAVGQHGLTPAVLHEIDVALTAHELIKIRVFSDNRAERDMLLARIGDELQCAPVQHLGKVLIVWRPRPTDEAPATPRKTPKAAHTPARKPTPKTAGKKPPAKPRTRSVTSAPSSAAALRPPRSTARSRQAADESKSDATRRGDQARRRRRAARA